MSTKKRSEQRLPPGLSLLQAEGRLLAQAEYRGQRKSKRFAPNEVARAKIWREDALREMRHGAIVPGTSLTVRKASEQFLAGARNGTILTRSREPYKPSTIRRYDKALKQRLLPQLGSLRLDEVRSGQLRGLIERWQGEGLAANTVRNAFMPLQAIYRWAGPSGLEYVAVDPTGVALPLDRSKRERFATATEAAALIAALAPKDRPLWATAFYAGLRRGELMALPWTHVQLGSGVIAVEFSHDDEADGGGVTHAPKSHAGVREVPIIGALREELSEHRLRALGDGDELDDDALVFSRRSLAGDYRARDGEFSPSSVYQRAHRVWKQAGLEPIALHECRHTFASLMIAALADAGKFDPKRLQELMGHSSITTTYDRYGHLMPGSHSDAAAALQAYLEAQISPSVSPSVEADR